MVVTDQSEGVTHGAACAYCLCRFTSDTAEAITVCESCGTPYHADCFTENGGCATFGCPAWVASQVEAGVPGVVVSPPVHGVAPAVPPAALVGGTSVASSQAVPENRGSASQQPASSQRPNFCSQCGSRVGPDYEFCSQCGQRIGVQA
jgi:hypothetical protein